VSEAAKRVSLRELARLAGKNPGQIHRLKSKGVLVPGADELFDADADLALVRSHFEQSEAFAADAPPASVQTSASADQAPAAAAAAPAGAAPAGSSKTSSTARPQSQNRSYWSARTSREEVEAENARLDLEERRGRLVDAEDVAAAQFEIARLVRDRMLAIPDRVGPILAAELDPHQVRELLSKEIRLALADALPAG
jgi:hypothetical protein